MYNELNKCYILNAVRQYFTIGEFEMTLYFQVNGYSGINNHFFHPIIYPNKKVSRINDNRHVLKLSREDFNVLLLDFQTYTYAF